jgi:hypothetical protein
MERLIHAEKHVGKSRTVRLFEAVIDQQAGSTSSREALELSELANFLNEKLSKQRN